MNERVQFITAEDNSIDLIVSYAIEDSSLGVKALLLHRVPSHEDIFDESERGVRVAMSEDTFEEEDFNFLSSISIFDGNIKIKTPYREYNLDISSVDESEVNDMRKILEKQNFDKRFSIHDA